MLQFQNEKETHAQPNKTQSKKSRNNLKSFLPTLKELSSHKQNYLEFKKISIRKSIINQVYQQKDKELTQNQINNYIKIMSDSGNHLMHEENYLLEANLLKLAYLLKAKKQEESIINLGYPLVIQKYSRVVQRTFEINLLALLNSRGGFLCNQLENEEEKSILQKKVEQFRKSNELSCNEFEEKHFYFEENAYKYFIISIIPSSSEKFPFFFKCQPNDKPSFYCIDQQNQLKTIKAQYLYSLIHKFAKCKNSRPKISDSFMVSSYDSEGSKKQIEKKKIKFQHAAILKTNSVDQEYKVLGCIKDILKDYQIKYSLINKYPLPNPKMKIFMLSFDEQFEVISNILKNNAESKVAKILRLINISKYVQMEGDAKMLDEKKFTEQFQAIFKEKPECRIDTKTKKDKKRIIYRFNDHEKAYYGFVYASYFQFNGKFANATSYKELTPVTE